MNFIKRVYREYVFHNFLVLSVFGIALWSKTSKSALIKPLNSVGHIKFTIIRCNAANI